MMKDNNDRKEELTTFFKKFSKNRNEDFKTLFNPAKTNLMAPSSEELIKELKIDGLKQDQGLKARIFNWVQSVVTCYLLFMAVVVLWHNDLQLSDNVMIALLTTTTINIIGLPALIIHSLFPKNKKDGEEEK